MFESFDSHSKISIIQEERLSFWNKLKLANCQPFYFGRPTVIQKFLSSKKKDCHPETNSNWPTGRLLPCLPNKLNKDGRKKWKRWSGWFVEFLEFFGLISFHMPSNCPTKLTDDLYSYQTVWDDGLTKCKKLFLDDR